MSFGHSKAVSSSQTGVHDRLLELVRRYQRASNQRPVAQHTLLAFRSIQDWLGNFSGEIMLDAGCGTGQSTALIAQQHVDAKIIGLDRSAARLGKHRSVEANNYALIRADISDFIRLAREHRWQIEKLFLLYPNPYPKSTQVQRRWHASPTMADMMFICRQIEVRSNWRIYCEEFAEACQQYGWHSKLTSISADRPLTLFERKYADSGQTCWRLTCERVPRQS